MQSERAYSTSVEMSTTPSTEDPLVELRQLVERIVRVTGLSTEKVIEHLQNEERDLGVTVRAELAQRGIEPFVWSDDLVEFYRSSQAMTFETVVWNRTAAKGRMRQWILDFLVKDDAGPKRILTFGDGLGFDSLSLARAGHTVDYYEVSENCIRFAGELFADAGVEVNMISSSVELDLGKYDAVVCLDVLEHVPDPCEVVEFLASALRAGGQLFVHAPFYYLSPAVQTHLRSNRRYSGALRRLYGRFGLRPIDAALFFNPLVLEKTGPGATPRRRGWLASSRLWAGQFLLLGGRYWSAPYVAVAKWMISRERQEWEELIALKRELEAEA